MNRRLRWLEPLGVVGLAALAGYFLAVSWRKWPDPLIDFGRELYLPWRLARGAVLYRDADDFYGPLSQYLNAGLFRIFGPGLMVLVAANLLVFAGIAVAIYGIFRRAWGAGAAQVSTAVFIAVFGFSQLGTIGNFNYATPYAHEATHGMLVCLLLVIALGRWIGRATRGTSFLAGLLLGLTLVLKPEFILAGGLVTATALVLRRRQRKALAAGSAIAWVGGLVLPTAAFTLLFHTAVSWREALATSSRAWLNVASTRRFTGDFIQKQFLGIDQPWPHLLGHASATLLAILLIGALCGMARLADGTGARPWRLALCIFAAGGTAWLALAKIDWLHAGPCLLGLTVLYLVVEIARPAPASGPEPHATASSYRILLPVLAVALLARMPLNGRIYEFGFYQAALAALLVPAVMIGELPARLASGRWGRTLLVAATVLLFGCGTLRLAARSHAYLRLKTFPVGAGRDLFYAVDPRYDPASQVFSFLCQKLQEFPKDGTLLVLPEGEMINYLTRRPCPVAPFFFFSAATAGGREDEIVRRLEQHPPDTVVLVSRDLRGYGINRYGENRDEGQQLLRWAAAHYRVAWHIGGDPLDFREAGGLILTRSGRVLNQIQ